MLRVFIFLITKKRLLKTSSTTVVATIKIPSQEDKEVRKTRMLQEKDLMRASILGNIKNKNFVNFEDEQINTSHFKFRGSNLAYGLRPSESINYVSKHDNQSLWDNTQYKLPLTMEIEDRIKLHSLQLSYPLLSFGVPFIHMAVRS